ncbi:MAG: AraC family transcriptional regulator [Flavobacteriales bacterium]|nr:AraC family transcriptional regulator [Flavobacteriales bacterium]
MPTNSMNDRMVGGEVFLGQDAFKLRSDLRAETDPERAFALVGALLLERIERLGLVEPDALQRAEQHLRKENGRTPITQLADIAGMSVRQLQRRSPAVYGLSPKAFAAAIRFNKVYGAMQRDRVLDLDLALDSSYYDESHMMKDLAYYLGGGPRRFTHLIRPLLDNNLGH